MPFTVFLKSQREDLLKSYFDYIKELLENDKLDETISYERFSELMYRLDKEDLEDDGLTAFEFITSEVEREDYDDKY